MSNRNNLDFKYGFIVVSGGKEPETSGSKRNTKTHAIASKM
jgi:hypothetical protein